MKEKTRFIYNSLYICMPLIKFISADLYTHKCYVYILFFKVKQVYNYVSGGWKRKGRIVTTSDGEGGR